MWSFTSLYKSEDTGNDFSASEHSMTVKKPPTVILMVGHELGPLRHGSWNPWVPLYLQSIRVSHQVSSG